MTLSPPARFPRSSTWMLVLALLLCLRLPTLVRPVGGDQHLYTYVAQRVLAGDVPYRDAWEQKPPAIFFVYAAALRVWPAESMVAAADLAATILIVWLLVRLGRQQFGPGVGETAAVIFLLLGDPGLHRFGGMHLRGQCEVFIALAITASLSLVPRQGSPPLRLMLAGVWLGLAFWLKYNAIVFTAPVALAAAWPASAAFDLRRAWSAVAWLAAGALFVSGVALLYFATAGALTDLWLGTVAYNVAYSGETYASALDAIRYVLGMPLTQARVDGLWFAGLLGCLLLAIYRTRDRRSLVVIGWVGAAVLSIALNGSRGLPQYFVQAGPALALAAAAGLGEAWRQRQNGRWVFAAVSVIVLAGVWRVGSEPVRALEPRLFGLPQAASDVYGDVRYLVGQQTRDAYLARFDRGDGGKYSPLLVERLAAHMAEGTRPDDRVYVFGFASGGVLALAHRASASRFFWSRPVVVEFASDRPGYGPAGLLSDLTRSAPVYVALQKHDWGLAEATTPDSIDYFLHQPALRDWLTEGYEPDYEDAAFVVWRRKV